MPRFEITAPDGRRFEVTAPEGASQDEVLAYAQANYSAVPAAPQTTAMGHAKELFKGVVPGAVGLLETAATGASALLPEDMEKAARGKIASLATSAKAPFAAAPGYEDSVTRKIGEGVGSTAPFFALGPLGLAGRAAAAGLGVSAGAGEAREAAEAKGATGSERRTATLLGAPTGLLDMLAPNIGPLKNVITTALARGGIEGATEAAQKVAQNLIAKGVYDPKQEVLAGSGEEGAYGAGIGALTSLILDMTLPGRGRARTAPPAPTQAAPQPGPQLAAEAPKGTQGALLPPEEMGQVGKAPAAPKPLTPTYTELVAQRDELLKAEPTPEVRAQLDAITTQLAGKQEGQGDLGLDFARTAEDATLERERLKRQPQTPEVQARIAELDQQLLLSTQSEVEALRAAKEAETRAAEEEAKARKKFPGLTNAPDLMGATDEVKARTQGELFPAEDLGGKFAGPQIPAKGLPPAAPTEQGKTPYQYKLPLRTVLEGRNPNRDLTVPARPGELTAKDIADTGVTIGPGVRSWADTNLVGKTKAEVQRMVEKDPTLMGGKTQRAKLLRELIAQQPAKFEETPDVTTTAPPPAIEPRNEPRASEPSVGVSGEPAGTVGTQPAAGVSKPTGAPAAPVGRGLVPTGQPVGKGTAPKAVQPPAVTPKAPKARKPSVEETTVPELPTAPAVQRLENAKTRAEFDAALDELVRIQRSTDHPDKDAVGEFIGSNLRHEAFEKAIRAAEQRTRAKVEAPKPAPAAAPTAETPTAPKKPVAERKHAAFYEPVGINRKTGAVIRGPQMLTIPMDDARARKYLEETARADEGGGEDVRDFFEELDAEIEAETTGSQGKQQELDFTKEPEPEPKAEVKPEPKVEPKVETKPEPKVEAKPAPKVEAKPWADEHKYKGQTVVYQDDDVALIRALNGLNEPQYFPMNRNGDQALSPTKSTTVSWMTPEFRVRLLDAEIKARAEEQANATKYPDGPFTGAKTNVVGSTSIDSRYVDYLHDLTQSLGMGNVRIFVYSNTDTRGEGALNKYKLYARYANAMRSMESHVNAAVIKTGGVPNTYALYLKDGMSETKTLEMLGHELGHVIQEVAYENADDATRKAVVDDYLKWRNSVKGLSAKEFVHALRNKEDAESNEQALTQAGIGDAAAKDTLRNYNGYWLHFDEWFADNVSRWTTTADKPLTITEKFFSKVAQMMRDFVAVVTGRKYPPAKSVANFLEKMGPATFTATDLAGTAGKQTPSFSVSFSTESLIDSMGPLDAEQKSGLSKLITGVKANPDVDYATKFRTQTADIAATIEQRLRTKFDGAVRDKLGNLNPMGLYRQAQDYSKMLLEYFQTGTLSKDPVTGLWKSGMGKGVRPPSEVYALIDKYAEKNGYSRERATQIASRVLEGVRLDAMRASNKTGATNFKLHLGDAEIDQLVREYNADPDLKEMSKLMDEARIAMVDNLVKVGRLTKEMGDEWKSVVGYVPFDRIEDFATKYSSAKKISTKGLAQLGKLPELIGSDVRPVGNVFDNYINTLGWMVGQTLKTDATVQTLRSLEDIGQAKYLGRSAQAKPNTVGAYVDGEMMYWELPSKYDLMAFKDLTPPKAGWLRALGEFSNVLRRSVTVLPPFALKQVTDDVQRAILTSGVKNPGALIRMSLTNFGGMAMAELRGIQHPTVKEFGALGLTGEYDFQAGKPATSLLKDLGYKKRSKYETLMHRLDGITRASDLAVRKAIYDQTLIETKDELLAQTRAREFINFRRRGASDFVGAMVTTIPFFNAYIQGMDVLYRAASGKDSSSSVDRAQARRLFWSRAGIVMMLSSMYALGKGDDDEDYNEMDLRTRDSNWILPGGYKIPVPGELGALFKVIPERVVEYMRRQGTPEEQTAWEATRTALSYMFEQYLGRVVPVPQAIKPVMEAWANKSFLTGRALEGYHHQAMDPSMRVTEQTSELAKAISVFSRDTIGVETSPIMIDNALRGYFGSSAAMLTMVTDSLLNPTRVDRPLHKYALLSNYLYDPVGTRRMTEFYEEREKVGKANTTLNELMKTDLTRAEQYAIDHQDELALESAVNATLNQLENTRAYRKFLNSVEGAKDMSADEREEALKEIKSMEVEYVKWVREAKAELAKAKL